MGNEPSHPHLLDWMANEFVASGWRLKHLHRITVTSSVHRQKSIRSRNDASADLWKAAMKADPQDVLLWGFPRRRLEAEVVRDAMLAVSDSLVGQMSGPGAKPPLPRELVNTLLKNQWKPSEQISDHYRRSIYVFARRNLLRIHHNPAGTASVGICVAHKSLRLHADKGSVDLIASDQRGERGPLGPRWNCEYRWQFVRAVPGL